jgi:ribosomal-protein-alanine N-acetyltransferase
MLREGDIILRPLSKDDAPVLASLLNNKKIWDNLRDYIPYPYLLNDALSFIQHTVNEVPQLTFAIEYKSHLAGIISLVAQTDIYKRTAEIGYWLGEPYWNKGVATIAVKLMTQHAFDELDFIRIHTGVIEYNIGSMNVLAKNRYTQEGIFRKAIIKNGQLYDEHRFAKIKE